MVIYFLKSGIFDFNAFLSFTSDAVTMGFYIDTKPSFLLFSFIFAPPPQGFFKVDMATTGWEQKLELKIHGKQMQKLRCEFEM